jgi:hypothetical protein
MNSGTPVPSLYFERATSKHFLPGKRWAANGPTDQMGCVRKAQGAAGDAMERFIDCQMKNR